MRAYSFRLYKQVVLILIQKIRQDINIGQKLCELRYKNGFLQEKLCVQLQRNGCDIARSCYAKYEAGELNIKVCV